MPTNNFNPRPTSTLQFDLMPEYDEAGEAYPLERVDVIEFVTGVSDIDFDTLEALVGYNWPDRIREIIEEYGASHEAEDLFE